MQCMSGHTEAKLGNTTWGETQRLEMGATRQGKIGQKEEAALGEGCGVPGGKNSRK